MTHDYNVSIKIGDEEEEVYREIVKERNERLMPGEHPWTFEEWMRVRLYVSMDDAARKWQREQKDKADRWRKPEEIRKYVGKAVMGTIEEEGVQRWTQSVIYDGQRWYTAAGMEIKGKLHVIAWKPNPEPLEGTLE